MVGMRRFTIIVSNNYTNYVDNLKVSGLALIALKTW